MTPGDNTTGTQDPTGIQSQQTQDKTTNPAGGTTFVAGAFGGQTPTPPPSNTTESNAEHPFQFNGDNFSSNNNEIKDPFAGGISSLSENTNPDPSQVIDTDNTDMPPIFSSDTIPSFDTPSIEQTVSIAEQTSVLNSDTTSTNSETPDTNNDFVLPNAPVFEQAEVIPPIQESTNIPAVETPNPIATDDFVLPSIDVSTTEPVQEITQSISNTIQEPTVATVNKEISQDTNNQEEVVQEKEVSSEEEAQETQVTTEENHDENNDEGEEDSVNEDLEDNITTNNDIDEYFRNFQHSIIEYYDTFNSDNIKILGHHTDTEKVEYEFKKIHKKATTIIKHHYITDQGEQETKTLSFDASNSLQVMLNEEVIADYSNNENIDKDIHYYIKDKLSKFTTMINDEIHKRHKKNKEAKKKTLENLRSF